MRFYGAIYYYHESDAAYLSALEAEAVGTDESERVDAAKGAYGKHIMV